MSPSPSKQMSHLRKTITPLIIALILSGIVIPSAHSGQMCTSLVKSTPVSTLSDSVIGILQFMARIELKRVRLMLKATTGVQGMKMAGKVKYGVDVAAGKLDTRPSITIGISGENFALNSQLAKDISPTVEVRYLLSIGELITLESIFKRNYGITFELLWGPSWKGLFNLKGGVEVKLALHDEKSDDEDKKVPDLKMKKKRKKKGRRYR